MINRGFGESMVDKNKKGALERGKLALSALNEGKAKEQRLHWRKRIYDIIEVGRGEDKISKIVDNFIIILIVLNLSGLYHRDRAINRSAMGLASQCVQYYFGADLHDRICGAHLDECRSALLEALDADESAFGLCQTTVFDH